MAAACWLALACAGCASSAAPVAFGSGLPQVAASETIHRQEREMFALLNQDRRAEGLPPLAYDERLADVARYHSADMRDHDFFEHESPNSGSLDDRLNAAGYLFLNARENLSEAPDVKRSQEGLMLSPPHHENIVATDVSHVGIGIVPGGVVDPRNLTVTQVFAKPGRHESVQDARAAVLKSIQGARAKHGLPAAKNHPVLQELAEQYLPELAQGAEEESVREIGKAVTEQVAARRLTELGRVLAGAQLLPDSTLVHVPDLLASSESARFGMAMRTVEGEGKRPMLQLLLLVGDK